MSPLLNHILATDALQIVFQPVVELIGDRMQLHMLECLTRGPHGTNAARADVMFEYVRRKRVEPTVDRACILLGLHAAAALPGTPDLSFNTHASTLGRDPEFPALLIEMADDVGIDPSRITIEIIEHAHGWDGETFDRALRTLRSFGARIALDDVGLGHSNYQMMIDTHPQYMKIDRYFVHGAHADLDRRAVLDSIAQLGLRLGARIIGEGVEETRDLATLTDAGIDLAQGYLFAKPLTTPELLSSGWLQPSAPKLSPARSSLAACPA
jgi:EAL domain-containing protein (putative c-di-GMP-specific phosphodiesterase class I)